VREKKKKFYPQIQGVTWDDDHCCCCVSILEQDVCRGVAHLVVQRPGVLPRWWARGALHLATQPRVISIHHVARVRRLLYQGLWRHLAPEVSRGGPTTMTTRHRRGRFCAGMPLILFANTNLHFLFKQACMVVRAWWLTMYDGTSTGVARALQWWDHANHDIYRSLHDTDGCKM
jgi:hypothetical protein